MTGRDIFLRGLGGTSVGGGAERVGGGAQAPPAPHWLRACYPEDENLIPSPPKMHFSLLPTMNPTSLVLVIPFDLLRKFQVFQQSSFEQIIQFCANLL